MYFIFSFLNCCFILNFNSLTSNIEHIYHFMVVEDHVNSSNFERFVFYKIFEIFHDEFPALLPSWLIHIMTKEWAIKHFALCLRYINMNRICTRKHIHFIILYSDCFHWLLSQENENWNNYYCYDFNHNIFISYINLSCELFLVLLAHILNEHSWWGLCTLINYISWTFESSILSKTFSLYEEGEVH